jgi:hypothetical protein
MAGVLRDRVMVDPAKVTSKRFVLWEPRSTEVRTSTRWVTASFQVLR